MSEIPVSKSLPVLGGAAASAGPAGVPVSGGPPKALKPAVDPASLVHKSLNIFFVVVLAGHIAAALKHHFIDRDDILTRMLPRHSKEN